MYQGVFLSVTMDGKQAEVLLASRGCWLAYKVQVIEARIESWVPSLSAIRLTLNFKPILIAFYIYTQRIVCTGLMSSGFSRNSSSVKIQRTLLCLVQALPLLSTLKTAIISNSAALSAALWAVDLC